MAFEAKKTIFLLLLLFHISLTGYSVDAKKIGSIVKKNVVEKSLIKFTENKKQWNKNVLYRCQLDGGALFLEKNAFTYNFYDKENLRKNHFGKGHPLSKGIKSHAFRMQFINANINVETSAQKITSDYCNYFIGNDKKCWASNVKNYKEVNYKNLYQGIDLQILGNQNSIKYNFIVAPKVNPDIIHLNYEGLEKISIVEGEIKLKTSLNEMTEQKPFAYQWINGKQKEVLCEFVLENNTIQFNFPKGYNQKYELVIDPILVFAASSGSLADNFGMSATYDSYGNLYAGGTAYGSGYPTTLGAYNETGNGSTAYISGLTDVVITKYDSSGTNLLYSTYLGGSTSTEVVNSLIVNAQDELLMYGLTGSSDFPVTPNAFDTTYNGGDAMQYIYNGTSYDNGTDIYVSKFNSAGTTLLASTYIGGSLNDGVNHNNDSTLLYMAFNSVTSAYDIPVYEFPLDSLQYNYGDQYRGEINVDYAGNAIITSSTRSTNFPIVNGFDNTLGGLQDAIVFKFNSDFSQLLWSTYLGGTDNDAGYALSIDDSSNIYVSGGTRSIDFPTTPGCVQPNYGGGKADGFITKIGKNGNVILASTFWGSAAYDQNYFVQIDKYKDVYVVGQTEGAMPVTANVYNNPNSGQFISKINGSLSTLLISTVFGNGNGRPNISPSAFLVDNCDNIYVCGWGGNVLSGSDSVKNMPLSGNAFQSTTDGHNFYLLVLSKNATSLLYATYFGGAASYEHVDGGTSRFDKKGIVYQAVCAGCGGHDDFPVKPGCWPYTSSNYVAYDPANPYPTGVNMNTQDNNCNEGVFKFDFQTPLSDATFTTNNLNGCEPLTIQFNYQNPPGATYLWDFGNNDTTSLISNPIKTFPTAGTYLVQLYVLNPANCNYGDTTYKNIVVYPQPILNLGNDTSICIGSTITLNAQNTGSKYLWSNGDTTQTIAITLPGTYWVNVLAGMCYTSDTINIALNTPTNAAFTINQAVGCVPLTIQCNYTNPPNTSFLWNFGNNDTTSITLNPSRIFPTAGIFPIQLIVTKAGSCNGTDTSIQNITIIPLPIVNIGNDTAICSDGGVFLDAGTSGTIYNWSNGAITESIYTTIPGTYSVTVSNGTCVNSDTTNIILIPSVDATFNLNQAIGCAPLTVNFNYVNTLGTTFLWDFGNGDTSSIANNPSITYSLAGTYSIKLIAHNSTTCNLSDTSIQQVVVISKPLVNIGNDTILCGAVNLNLDAGNNGYDYVWSTGDTTQTINITSPMVYWVTVINNICKTTDSIFVNEISTLPFGNDSTLCQGQSVSLNASNPGASYLWSTGETTQSINVNTAGEYWANVTLGPCISTDTININFIQYPIIDLPSDSVFCVNNTIVLDAGSGATHYIWSTGDTTQTISVNSEGLYYVSVANKKCITTDSTKLILKQFNAWLPSYSLCEYDEFLLDASIKGGVYVWSTGDTSQVINIEKSGDYWVTTLKDNCFMSDTTTLTGTLGGGVIYFPNTFTPNGNGLNDYFTCISDDVTFFHMTIFDRWGELIYETESQQPGWDGTYKGKFVPNDIYVWTLEYKKTCSDSKINRMVGHVLVLR